MLETTLVKYSAIISTMFVLCAKYRSYVVIISVLPGFYKNVNTFLHSMAWVSQHAQNVKPKHATHWILVSYSFNYTIMAVD